MIQLTSTENKLLFPEILWNVVKALSVSTAHVETKFSLLSEDSILIQSTIL